MLKNTHHNTTSRHNCSIRFGGLRPAGRMCTTGVVPGEWVEWKMCWSERIVGRRDNLNESKNAVFLESSESPKRIISKSIADNYRLITAKRAGAGGGGRARAYLFSTRRDPARRKNQCPRVLYTYDVRGDQPVEPSRTNNSRLKYTSFYIYIYIPSTRPLVTPITTEGQLYAFERSRYTKKKWKKPLQLNCVIKIAYEKNLTFKFRFKKLQYNILRYITQIHIE